MKRYSNYVGVATALALDGVMGNDVPDRAPRKPQKMRGFKQRKQRRVMAKHSRRMNRGK